MVALEKITAEMFPDIYDAFLADDDARLTRDDWQAMFTPSPYAPEDYCGYALLDGDKPVGVLGTYFSERTIDGQTVPFCNLHTWKVEPAYRGHSLFMMRPVLAMKDHTITDFTPTEDVCTISKRLGFEPLNSTLKILLPFSGKRKPKDLELLDDPAEIEDRLNEADRKLLQDHRQGACGHLLADDGKETCYVIYTRVPRRVMPYCYLHYVSNRQAFARLHGPIRSALCARAKTRYCTIDARQTAGVRIPKSINCPVKTRQLFKSQRVGAEQIDSLYSELIFLNLSTYPALGYLAQRVVKKLWSIAGG